MDRRITHGMSKTPTYRSWWDMKKRCEKPSFKQWSDYGGRGITYCQRWSLFENFLDDMGAAPKGHTLERINVDGNYDADNCRWATMKAQGRNRRNNRMITYKGRTMCAASWAEEIGATSIQSLLNRIDRGWTLKESFETPFAPPEHFVTFEGVTLSIAAWSKHLGVPYQTIKARFRKGWTPRDVLKGRDTLPARQ